MAATQILIVDDDPVQRRLLEAHVARMGYRPLLADGGEPAMAALLRGAGAPGIAAVVLDLVMPGMSGLDVLRAMRRAGLDMPVVVQTAKGGVDVVVEAMRAGAFDFVVKPVSPEKLQATIGHAVRVGAAGRRAAARGAPPAGLDALRRPASPAMAKVLRAAERAAGSAIPVLIEGETGVGKEWLAEAIRAAGPRSGAPFVAVNCGALPGPLVESLLFGHEKGAFTDATERRAGRFLEADGGTLFLDEVGELPPEAQVKLLRVLQRGEVDPVGARTPVRTNVRIVSATNRNLEEDVRAGRFREDLYYRLNVFPIRIPPLRERREEIAGLSALFLARYGAVETDRPARSLSAETLRLLSLYDWPGNIRQLENVIHRAVVVADGAVLQPSDFPQVAPFVPAEGEDAAEAKGADPAEGAVSLVASAPYAAETPTGPGLAALDASGALRALEAVEADLIRLACRRYGGRMSEIARRLGIGRSTLYRKLRRYGIETPGAEDRQAEAPDAVQHSLGCCGSD